MENKFLISLPYIYPVCPISIDHARMFVVADINARMQRKKGKEVCFPIAAHFSGVTAEKACELLNKKISKDEEGYTEKEKMYNIFLKVYQTPDSIIRAFKTPEDILNYYSYQTIWNLKEINVSCDYENFYTTNTEEFETFVKVMFEFYEKHKILILNSKNELALNYDDEEWKEKTLENFKKIDFIQSFHKPNFIGAFDNIRSDWGLLREYGMGIKYNEKYIIDPMFDSELFTLFDLYMKFRKDNESKNVYDIFEKVFEKLNKDEIEENNDLPSKIVNWMGTDLFVCEEHLKTWVVKKTYAETLLLKPRYHTKKYFITGMGSINHQRMSSSRGTAVLSKDMIENYGNHNARLIILMTGGHPSKLYNYDVNLPKTVMDMTKNFKEYINFLNSIYMKNRNVSINNEYEKDKEEIEKNIETGYYQQAIIDMMKIMPKKNKQITPSQAKEILNIYKEYLDILLPNFLTINL